MEIFDSHGFTACANSHFAKLLTKKMLTLGDSRRRLIFNEPGRFGFVTIIDSNLAHLIMFLLAGSRIRSGIIDHRGEFQ